ncbi:MAG: TIGR01777 family oxidoreductase [Candidatus Aminicenantes bacterium]|jgi:uncharacterized protein (TIGR01777 family)
MERVIVTGATGFIGRALCGFLAEKGFEVVVLTRNVAKGKKTFGDRAAAAEWDGKSAAGWQDYANGAYAIVNLAGENIASGRWTPQKKESILQSRLKAAEAVLEAVQSVQKKPRVVVQASAVGYYGSSRDEVRDESSSSGKGFLTDVTKEWEQSTRAVEDFGVRHVVIRSGVVLGSSGGALLPLVKPFRFFVGGPLGNGRQWLSWIHLRDEVNAIHFLLKRKDLHGVFNLTAPHPLRQKDFARLLGKILGKPSWFPAPRFMLRMVLGQMADEMLLASQKVVPKRLLEAGYQFLYPEAEPALKDILENGIRL